MRLQLHLTKTQRITAITTLLILPLFIVFAIQAVVTRSYGLAAAAIGIWVFFFLFAASYLFQALVYLLISLVSFYYGHWVIGLVCLVLVPYLFYASRLLQLDPASRTGQMGSLWPTGGELLSVIREHRSLQILLALAFVVSALLVALVAEPPK